MTTARLPLILALLGAIGCAEEEAAPPILVYSEPADDSTEVPVTTDTLVMEFDRAFQSIGSSGVETYDEGLEVRSQVALDSNTIYIRLDEPLAYDTTYVAGVYSVLTENGWLGEVEMRFTTEPDPVVDPDTDVDTESPCGNGVLDRGEECDDGDAQAGDGCDDQCLYELFPVSSFQTANRVLGQASLSEVAANRGGAVGANTLDLPIGPVSIVNGRLYVMDSANGRLLLFDAAPQVSGAAADRVLGRPSTTNSDGIGPNGGSLGGFSRGTRTDGTRLLLGDPQRQLIQLFDPAPDADQVPDLVLGQPTIENRTPGTTAALMDSPYDASIGGGVVAVADTGNHRILLYDTIPTAAGQPADAVWGQPDLTSGEANRGGSVAANSLSSPEGVWTDGHRLVIADSGNNRVLVFNDWPTSPDDLPDAVLGQLNFTTGTAATGPGGMHKPTSPFVFGQQLFVPDNRNNRVLIWMAWPESAQPASVVLGQETFFGVWPNDDQDGASGRTLSRPTGAYVHDGSLYITDSFNHRVLVFDE